MIVFGLGMVFGILETLIDVIPFVGTYLGDFVGMATTLLAFIIAVPLALLTIAIAWLFVRPVLSAALALVIGAALYFLWKKRQDGDSALAAAPA